MELTLDQILHKGIEAYKAGNVNLADQCFTTILKIKPNHPDANHNLGVLSVNINKVKESVPFFEKALEVNPTIDQFWVSYIDALIKLDRINEAEKNINYAKNNGISCQPLNELEKNIGEIISSKLMKQEKSLFDKAIKLRESSNYDKAIDLLEKGIISFPEDFNMLALISHCFILKNEIEKAKEYLDKAKEISPDASIVKWNEVRLLLKIKKHDEALKIAKKAIQFFPDDQEGLVVLSACLRVNGDIKESLETINKVIELNPNSAEAYINRSIIRLLKKENSKALDDLEKAHQIKPHFKQIWNLIIKLKVEMKDYSNAIIILINILKIDPNYDKNFSMINELNQKANDPILAIKSFLVALEINPKNVKTLLNLGIAQRKNREFNNAIETFNRVLSIDSNIAEAYYGLGNIFNDQNKSSEALKAYEKALFIKSDYPEVYNSMGFIFQKQKKLEKALEFYKKALLIKSNFVEVINNIGNIFDSQGKFEKAIQKYRYAISIKPDYAEAFFNMGNSLQHQLKLEEAKKSYNQALLIKPDYVEVYNNLGIILQKEGNHKAALMVYEKGLSLKPNYAELINNMGTTLEDLGMFGEAIDAFTKALSIKPDYTSAYKNFANILKYTNFKVNNPLVKKLIISLLDIKTIARPIDICLSSISLLKFEKEIREIINQNDEIKIELNFNKIINGLANSPLLLKLMSLCSIPDLEIELALQNIRSYIVSNISKFSNNDNLMIFQSALAHQCFINEYVYYTQEKDKDELSRLEALVEKDILGSKELNLHHILCLASFKPLYKYKWCETLSKYDKIKEVYIRQVEEPRKEKKLKEEISSLEEIKNKVSLAVRDQYEINPYPRWINTQLHEKPLKIEEIVQNLKLNLVDNSILKQKNMDILIAGCGTGQQSLETAKRFENSKVLAVDLSLSSLAYAKRKTIEYEINNIEYKQADILNLKKLNQKFNIIESVGVLHHLEDPMAGWEVLNDCLVSGGLMKIGLYSELARKNLVKIREEIASRAINSNYESIIGFRSSLINSKKAHHHELYHSYDFYNLSTIRDLIFHVKEHRFDIPKIKKCLNQLGLKFCGFESNKIVKAFKQKNKEQEDIYDLDKWCKYEEENPKTFVAMYQFWCQKI